MARLLIKNGHIVGPRATVCEKADVYIAQLDCSADGVLPSHEIGLRYALPVSRADAAVCGSEVVVFNTIEICAKYVRSCFALAS